MNSALVLGSVHKRQKKNIVNLLVELGEGEMGQDTKPKLKKGCSIFDMGVPVWMVIVQLLYGWQNCCRVVSIINPLLAFTFVAVD